MNWWLLNALVTVVLVVLGVIVYKTDPHSTNAMGTTRGCWLLPLLIVALIVFWIVRVLVHVRV